MREEKPKTGLPALPSPRGRSGAFSTSWNRRGQRQPPKAPGEWSTLLAKKRRR